MKRSTTRDKLAVTGVAQKLGIAGFWILVWELAYRAVNKIYVVSPGAALLRLWELARQRDYWIAVSGTCGRVLAGFVISLLAGMVLAGLTSRFPFLHRLCRPLLEVIKATPVASFIILALVWMSDGQIPAFIIFLMVMPMIWSNLHAGLSAIDTGLLEMTRIFQFSFWKRVRFLYIPSLTPYFVSACTTGLGFAWKCAIAAEVISHPANSIGINIYNSRIYLEMADLFAWTLTVIAMSVVLEKIAVTLLDIAGKKLLTTAVKVKGDCAGA